MSRPSTKRIGRTSSAPRRPRPTRRLELALSRIASAAVEAQGLDEALRAIHAVLGELIEAKNLYVALVDETEGVLRFPYIVDERASDPGVLPVGHGLAGYVLRTGETLLATPEVFDTLAERGQVDPIGPAAVDWLGAPLRIGGRTIGVIAVQSYTESVRFTEADRGLLTYVSSHVAEAIERKRAEEALRESEERFRLVFEQSPVGIAMIRMDTTYERVNEAFESLLGRPGGDLLGRKLGEFTHPDDVPRARALFGRLAAGEIESFRIETRHLRPDHTPVQVLSTVQLVREPTGAGHHVLLQSLDISDLKRAEEEVRRLAYHDALTGLPNRRLFEDRVEVAISHAHRHGQGLVLMFLDLDRFKLINDSLGHGFGDTVLRRVAERLKAALREGDTVARLGGDEFLLLLPDVVQPADAARIADKLLDVTSRPIDVGDREVIVTCSIGISVFPEDGLDAGTLIRNADTAMYRAKDEGREGHQLYAPAMNERALERLALEHGLRRAISQGELELHYQPILTLETGRVHGVEALLRWNHPLWGWVPPAEFIPIAECTGLIGTLGAWVLRTACLQVRQWQRDGHAELVLAVNLAPRQFQQPGIHELVETILRETGLAPHHLELEVTESSALQNPEASTANLRRLEALGIRVSIDDFGTGYSSLSYLRRFPVDIVKIDKSFVQDITTDADDAAIAKAVIAMAHSLHLTVTAEGVETADQLAFLSSHGCDRVQGFLFSRALPPRECEVLLARHGPGDVPLTK